MIKPDPRTRIIILFIISSAAVLIRKIGPLFWLFLMTLILCRLFSISLSASVKRLRKLWYFFLVFALVQSIFTSGGETIFSIGNIRILTTMGLESGISIMLRMSIVIFSALIVASAPPLEIVYGLTKMKLPYEIAFMVLLAMKFLPLFREEFSDSIAAVQLAGADLHKIPLRQKLSLYACILTPSVAKALSRARYISLSMECRAFRAYPCRTDYCILKMKGTDYTVILATLTMTIIIFICLP